ncbi:MAG: Acetyl-coenzyme A synthetase [Pseudoclavibacter caeni]
MTTLKPGSAQRPVPGVSLAVVDDSGRPVPAGRGRSARRRPAVAVDAAGVWDDEQRYRDTYWSVFGDRYFAGDGARLDEDGDLWLLGRVDDVMNVSGHRLSTAEIESALVAHHAVAEAAVVGAPDPDTGQAVVAFVVLKRNQHLVELQDAPAELRAHVAATIGAIARPKAVHVVPDLPKTRSGKIIRRVLAALASGAEVGDLTTVSDPSVIDTIRGIIAADGWW